MIYSTYSCDNYPLSWRPECVGSRPAVCRAGRQGTAVCVGGGGGGGREVVPIKILQRAEIKTFNRRVPPTRLG